MNTVVITGKEDISLDDLRFLLASHWTLRKTPPDRLAIEESNSRVYIYHPRLDSGGTDSKCIFLDYSSQNLVKRVVMVIGDSPQLLIDNEYNTVLPGDQFVAKLRSDPAWDWRA